MTYDSKFQAQSRGRGTKFKINSECEERTTYCG
jgi:hypothetical protein